MRDVFPVINTKREDASFGGITDFRLVAHYSKNGFGTGVRGFYVDIWSNFPRNQVIYVSDSRIDCWKARTLILGTTRYAESHLDWAIKTMKDYKEELVEAAIDRTIEFVNDPRYFRPSSNWFIHPILFDFLGHRLNYSELVANNYFKAPDSCDFEL